MLNRQRANSSGTVKDGSGLFHKTKTGHSIYSESEREGETGGGWGEGEKEKERERERECVHKGR